MKEKCSKLSLFCKNRHYVYFSPVEMRFDVLVNAPSNCVPLVKPKNCSVCSCGGHCGVSHRSGEDPDAKPAWHWLCGRGADVQEQLRLL